MATRLEECSGLLPVSIISSAFGSSKTRLNQPYKSYKPEPEVIKLLSCSIQLSMKFKQHTNIRIVEITGIFMLQ